MLHVPQDDAQRLYTAGIGRGLGFQGTQQVADPCDKFPMQSAKLRPEIWIGYGGERV